MPLAVLVLICLLVLYCLKLVWDVCNSAQVYNGTSFQTSGISRDVQCQIKEKSSGEAVEKLEQTPSTRMHDVTWCMSYARDSTWLLGNLQDDGSDGSDGGISRKFALEDDLSEQSVEMSEQDRLKD